MKMLPILSVTLVIGIVCACSERAANPPVSSNQAELRGKAVSLLTDLPLDTWTSKPIDINRRQAKGTTEWLAKSADNGEIRVAITSGTIAQVSCIRPGDYFTSCPAERAISKETAVRIASELLSRVAPLANVEFEKADYEADYGTWTITWRRYENGLRFHNDKTWVALRSDGSLRNLKREMYSPMPDNAGGRRFPQAKAQQLAMDVSKQFWENNARMALEESSVTMQLKGVQLLVVRPNNPSWLKAHGWTYTGLDGATRLAYVFAIESQLPKPPKRVLFWCDMEVWIDCETGEVVGMDYAGAFVG